MSNTRLAIVTTHPIQYYAPWFRHIAAHNGIELKVFYLWNPAMTTLHDPGFSQEVEWDLPLLEGYDWEFVPNVSRAPGSARFNGINNPTLLERLGLFQPEAALLIGYRYRSLLRLIFSRGRKFPLFFRGDSHRLGKVESRKLKVEIKRRAIGRIFNRFDAFLCVGKANREYFRMHDAPEEKLFFSPHAVDNERFWLTEETRAAGQAWRRELGIADDDLLVMFAGKFEDKKRPLDLLRAFPKLDRTDVSLLFVGSGKLDLSLREAAAGKAKVLFAPFQNQSAMPRTYAAADLVVLPSFGNEETWGLVINEALCAARPVIVSNHVGCAADLVHPDMNGLVFEAGNIEALTEALRDAVSDRERLREWGKAGQEIVRSYDYAHATRGLQDAIQYVRKSGRRK